MKFKRSYAICSVVLSYAYVPIRGRDVDIGIIIYLYIKKKKTINNEYSRGTYTHTYNNLSDYMQNNYNTIYYV